MFDSDKDREIHPGVSAEDRINRDDLLKRLFQRQGGLKLDPEALKNERERLLAEVRSLEDENHLRARRVKELQLQLFDRRKMIQRLFQRSDELKKKLVQLLAKENNLIHEIRFLESERDKYGRDYREISGRVKGNMTTIAAILRDIEFMRGELETLMDKTGYLEDGVPNKFRDIDSLDEKISGSLQALEDLYNKMRAVEKNTKMIYYRKEKGIARNLP